MNEQIVDAIIFEVIEATEGRSMRQKLGNSVWLYFFLNTIFYHYIYCCGNKKKITILLQYPCPLAKYVPKRAKEMCGCKKYNQVIKERAPRANYVMVIFIWYKIWYFAESYLIHEMQYSPFILLSILFFCHIKWLIFKEVFKEGFLLKDFIQRIKIFT